MNSKIFKTSLIILADILAVVLALTLAVAVTQSENPFSSEFFLFFGINCFLVIIAFFILRLYSVAFANVGIIEGVKITIGLAVVAAIDFLLKKIFSFAYISSATIAVFISVLFYIVFVSRFYKRFIKLFSFYLSPDNDDKKRVMIIGAGDVGETTIKELRRNKSVGFVPVCVLDDDQAKIGTIFNGVKVVGNTFEIKKYAEQFEIDEIFVAIAKISPDKMAALLKRAGETDLPVKRIPATIDILKGNITLSTFKNVEIQDLLGRPQVQVDLNQIMGYIENKIVLITGGGGSIGSELCRQVASHNPKELIIVDIYENNAYDIQQELRTTYPSLDLKVLIASVRDESKIDFLFSTYRPNIVFHAAAHKHVPLMEDSPNEAIKNNVFGTLNVAKTADKYAVETFVLISTDKAVNPTNIMGASKRICEMIIQTIGRKSKNTKFVAVRFGNVLGSNGSVIPLFKKQIEQGGPVTVTHKDIIRYFMTIPEAVSLVLQAGAFAKSGQIYVLDMGEPVKIYDLAEKLIKLSGYEPNVDIDIICTGLRPGEKLYEERLMDEEGLESTENGLISVAKPLEIDEELLSSTLEELKKEAKEESADIKKTVQKLVTTYVIDER